MIKIHLGSEAIPLDTFASQGNAILGIRGSGKTYTATFLAEQLLKAGVPFVAFDPIGVWRFLKVPGAGKGFKVVVAGENGDLPLTPQTAPEIVRAAMRENIPLVIDLYSMRLSKADWKAIVESAIRLLLYENKDCGLRHIFIEEAAEFCPQRVGPDQGRVYAEIEKLARMGGNASLGYTLINQRAEEVNKAVLELCDCLFLHRQKGRNSLVACEKWLNYANPARASEIATSLPTLGSGHCWIWTEGSSEPKPVKVPEKDSFHPDRKNPGTAQAKQATDVGSFVSQLKTALGKTVEKINADDPAFLKKRIAELEKQLKDQPVIEKKISVLTDDDRSALANAVVGLTSVLSGISSKLETMRPLKPNAKPLPPPRPIQKVRNSVHSNNGSGEPITGGARRMLTALAQRSPLSKKQLGVRAGLSSSSGTFATYLGRLRSLDSIDGGPDDLSITETGLSLLGEFDPLPTGRGLFDYWMGELSGGAARMLSVLYENGEMTGEQLGKATEISPTSGTFATYLGRLRSLELVKGGRDNLHASEELYD